MAHQKMDGKRSDGNIDGLPSARVVAVLRCVRCLPSVARCLDERAMPWNGPAMRREPSAGAVLTKEEKERNQRRSSMPPASLPLNG